MNSVVKFKLSWWLKIVLIFIVWRLALFGVSFFAPIFIPNFGNQFPYANTALSVSGLPQWVWEFGNFDGVHYVRAAQTGYESKYSQAFFPGYFLLIKDLSLLMTPVLAGLVVSNLFFLAGLLVFYKLLRQDYDSTVSLWSVIFLISFPTAFYFGSIYTESLFFFLVVTCLYYLKQTNFFFAGLFALLASGTRVIGLLLLPVLIWNFYQNYRPKQLLLRTWEGKKAFLGIFLAPLGLLFYMLYLATYYNDPLLFLNSQPGFGAERSALPFILLPQVFYRYAKILLSVPLNSQFFFTASLELGFTLVMIGILMLTFKKTPKDYWAFAVAALLVPTLTGTLSSMPRYSLMCFLVFPALVIILKRWKIAAVFAMAILQAILATIFLRGYWIA